MSVLRIKSMKFQSNDLIIILDGNINNKRYYISSFE